MSSKEKITEIIPIENSPNEKKTKYEKEIKRKFDFFILCTTTISFIVTYLSFFPVIMGIFTPFEHMIVCLILALIFLIIWTIYCYKDKNYKIIFIIPWFIPILIFYWLFTKLANWQLYNYIYHGISPNKILIFSTALILGIISSIIYQLLKIKSYKKYFKNIE